MNLDKMTDRDAEELIGLLQDFIKDKQNKYYIIDKIETIFERI